MNIVRVPKLGYKKRKVSKIRTISRDNSETAREKIWQLLYILLLIGSHRRSFDWYRPRWPWTA